ncbi:MAG: hypothetical protein JWO02_2815 [Solirubrobacterales bacterium]|nr:hypothetical protein [Solirubrobacterales bacterium]
MRDDEHDEQPRTDLAGMTSVRDLPPPKRRPSREITIDLPPYDQRTGISAHDRLAAEKARRPGAAQTIARTLAGFAVVAAIIVGIFLALGALESDSKPSAAWSKPGAPVVTPAPLDGQ